MGHLLRASSEMRVGLEREAGLLRPNTLPFLSNLDVHDEVERRVVKFDRSADCWVGGAEIVADGFKEPKSLEEKARKLGSEADTLPFAGEVFAGGFYNVSSFLRLKRTEDLSSPSCNWLSHSLDGDLPDLSNIVLGHAQLLHKKGFQSGNWVFSKHRPDAQRTTVKPIAVFLFGGKSGLAGSTRLYHGLEVSFLLVHTAEQIRLSGCQSLANFLDIVPVFGGISSNCINPVLDPLFHGIDHGAEGSFSEAGISSRLSPGPLWRGCTDRHAAVGTRGLVVERSGSFLRSVVLTISHETSTNS